MNCQYTLKPQEQFRVLQGILVGVLNIATEGPFCAISALQETGDAVPDSTWTEQVSEIRASADGFLRTVMLTFKQIFEANSTLFSQILKEGARNLARHVGGEKALEFLQTAI